MEDLEIGETFQFKDKNIKVVKETNEITCFDCYFYFNESIGYSCDKLYEMGMIPECADLRRRDETPVIFVEETEVE